MLCQQCQKAQATVHIDEVHTFNGPGAPENEVDQHHLCETCAQSVDLPNIAVHKNTMDEVWKLLQMSALKSSKKPTRPSRACGTCKTTEEQLKRKGRVGCQDCYDTFSDYLDGLLERMHGATQHEGRLPGVDVEAASRQRAITDAQAELDRAVEEEDFERAAELRDELQRLAEEASASSEPAAAESAQDEGTSATS